MQFFQEITASVEKFSDVVKMQRKPVISQRLLHFSFSFKPSQDKQCKSVVVFKALSFLRNL
jgi:hypothetical protein